MINSRKRPGLKKLIEEVGLTSEKIKSENIAYIIVPHLNAAGRLLDAKIGGRTINYSRSKENY